MVSYAREGFNEDAAIRVNICERGRFSDRLRNGIRRTPHKCGTGAIPFLIAALLALNLLYLFLTRPEPSR